MKNIFKIIRLAKDQQKWILLALTVITLRAVLQQAAPITLKFVVDELTKQITLGTGSFDKLIKLFVLLLGINLVGVLLNSINQRLGDHIASRFGRFLTEIFYKKIFTLPQKYFDSEISGKIVNQLVRGIYSIKEFVNGSTNFIMPALLQTILGIGVLMYVDFAIGALALAVFPFYIAISNYSTKKWGEIQEEKNVYEDSARGRIQEVIGNIKLVKTYNTQNNEWKQVSLNYEKLNKLYDRQSNQYHLLNFVRELGLELVLVIILLLIFIKTFQGLLSLGEMILVIQILNQLRWPLYAMSYILEQIQRANADSKDFFEVLELPGTEMVQKRRLSVPIKNPEIEFEKVSFAYDDGAPILKDISFILNKQETVAIVGHSGAGKTTLINLILKLYDATSGVIKISGKKYNQIDHAWVRSHMALVFQDAELFSSTIRENVIYGMDKVTDKQIVRALKQANALEFVKNLKGGLEAQIGERGVKLSGGQKQRIQIARAILQDKPILILDEATSSLDSISERAVQNALEKLFKNRLVLIIAHRFSTIQNADKIIVIDEGKIADTGTPQELARRKGLYSELLRYQIEGDKKLLSEYDIEI